MFKLWFERGISQVQWHSRRTVKQKTEEKRGEETQSDGEIERFERNPVRPLCFVCS